MTGHITKLTAYREETEPGRLERLTLVLQAIDEAKSPRPLRMHDHKGGITVWWPTAAEFLDGHAAVAKAWEDQCEFLIEHRVGAEGRLATRSIGRTDDWPVNEN